MSLLRPGTTDALVLEETERGYHRPPLASTPRTVLDLGCNVGLTVRDYEAVWPSARILGVEMDPWNAGAALQTCCSPILCAAVASEHGVRRYATAGGEYAYRLADDGERYARAVTLGWLVRWMGGHVDFVKMDVEGAEWEILSSGSWEREVDALLVELHPQTDESVGRATTLLEVKGYRVERHSPHPAGVWATREAA